MAKTYFVYINTNKYNKVLYTGVTANLLKRNWQHKEGQNKTSFVYKYNVNKLVYYEGFGDVTMAINREKQIKNLLRSKKIDLINAFNKDWKDLAD
jgi:putative endonuclease